MLIFISHAFLRLFTPSPVAEFYFYRPIWHIYGFSHLRVPKVPRGHHLIISPEGLQSGPLICYKLTEVVFNYLPNMIRSYFFICQECSYFNMIVAVV